MLRDFTYAAACLYRPVQYSVLIAVVHSLACFSLVQLAERCHFASTERALHSNSTEISISSSDRVRVRSCSVWRASFLGLSLKD